MENRSTTSYLRNYYAIGIVVITLMITYLHYSTIQRLQSLHDIYRALYYVPVLFAAIFFGLKGAALTYLLVLILYLPFIYSSWTGVFIFETDRLLHVFLQGIFGGFAGYFVDRDRKNREQLERERYLAGVGQVATTIVHDLKNPLITIRGFSRRILEGKGNVNSAAKEIADSALQMEKIVHDVLDFAKPVKLELKQEDMRNVINRSYDSCKAKAEYHGVDISLNLPSDPVNVISDAFHIERAVINLMNNAIEASRKGQNISVSMARGEKNVIIKVEDEGSGMDKNTLDNLFIPFYTSKSGGTGLGMPISKKIIEAHKGTVDIYSQPGKGTDVTIRLPYG